jgi:Spy/CpxP family protein refolding chaperone
MKKTIIAIAVLAIFSIENTFAQKGYPSKGKTPTTVYHSNNTYGVYSTHQLDNIVSLTRKQENAIKQIEKRYDRLTAKNRKNLNMQSIKRLDFQKQQEILSVLTPVQHQRLIAYERGMKHGRNANRPIYRG